jgi:hypothetical protein
VRLPKNVEIFGNFDLAKFFGIFAKKIGIFAKKIGIFAKKLAYLPKNWHICQKIGTFGTFWTALSFFSARK